MSDRKQYPLRFINPKIRKKLEAEAEKNDRSLNYWINKILKKHLKLA